MNRLNRTLITLSLLLWGQQAFAVPIAWNLEDVTFSDGGTLNGSFMFDSETDSLTNWSILSSGGDILNFPEFTYDTSNSIIAIVDAPSWYNSTPAGPEGTFYFSSRNTPNEFNRYRDLLITPTELLDGSLTSVSLKLFGGIGTNGGEECYYCSPFRGITGGNFVMASVPEPSSIVLFGLGLITLLSMKKGQRKDKLTV